MLDKKEKIVTKEQISSKVRELGKTITKDYKDKSLLVLGLLNGATLFVSDLVREIDLELRMDFIKSSSYGDNKFTSGEVKLEFLPDIDYTKYDVLLVDDLLDTGVTIKCLVNYLKEKGSKSVKTATLLNKPERNQIDFLPDYLGFNIENRFVVGYGLDYRGYGRNLQDVWAID